MLDIISIVKYFFATNIFRESKINNNEILYTIINLSCITLLFSDLHFNQYKYFFLRINILSN